MFARIFPRQLDNNFRGHWLAIWLLVPIVFVKLMIGVRSMLDPRAVAATADGIPLGHYAGGGAEAVVSLFALLGMFQALLALLGVVVLVRYRAMIAFMYLLLLVQQLGSRTLDHLYPIAAPAASGTPPGTFVALGIIAATLTGFILSLVSRPNAPLAAEGAH